MDNKIWNPDDDRKFEQLAKTLSGRDAKKKKRVQFDGEYDGLDMDPRLLNPLQEEYEEDDSNDLYVRDYSRPGPGMARDLQLSFSLPLITSLVPFFSLGSATPTFTRATTATVVDHDGTVRPVLSGEPRFMGARRVQNFVSSSTDISAWNLVGTAARSGNTITCNALNDGITRTNVSVAVGDSCIVSFRVDVDAACVLSPRVFNGNGSTAASSVATLTAPGSYRIQVAGTITVAGAGGGLGLLAGTTDYPFHVVVSDIQFEKVNGQAVQVAAEPVSIGVLSAPYHGAGVDGVKYFDRHNGNVLQQNLLLQSQTFNVGSWNQGAISFAANRTTAPDGTMTAERMTEDTSATTHYTYQGVTVIAGAALAGSIYLKAGERHWTRVNISGPSETNSFGVYFDLHNGRIGAEANIGDGVLIRASITPVGGGWYRCEVAGTIGTDTTGYLLCRLSTGNSVSSYTGDGVSGLYLWGAQLQYGRRAGTYVPTTTAAVNNNIVEEALGDAIDTDTALGYLAEGARTNLALVSESFGGATWAKNAATTSDNSAVAPDGTTTADKLQEDNTSAQHRVTQSFTKAASAITYTASVWAKAAERSWVVIVLTDGSNGGGLYVNLVDGTTDSGPFGSGWTIDRTAVTEYPNGWYRCQLTVTTDTGTSLQMRLHSALSDSGTSTTFAGTTGSGLYLWGAQLEVGSFASSYIPTTSAAVTRNADVLNYAGLGNISPVVGACYAELSTQWASTEASSMAVLFDDLSGRLLFLSGPGTAATAATIYDGTTSVQKSGLTSMNTGVRKRASSWGGNVMQVAGDGAAVASGAFDGRIGGGTTSTIAIGGQVAAGNNWFGTIRNVELCQRVPEDLAALTA